MLIDLEFLVMKYNLAIGGILHIGAHQCEEAEKYRSVGIEDDRVLWIEGNPSVAEIARLRFPDLRIVTAVIGDQEKECEFIVTNNFQSSSVLELETHKTEHPWVVEIGRRMLQMTTIDKMFKRESFDPKAYNFVNIDIQGAELMALKGMSTVLPHVDYLYLEVNVKSLYKDCALIDEIDDFLSDFERVETLMTSHGWGDAFYVRKTLLDRP